MISLAKKVGPIPVLDDISWDPVNDSVLLSDGRAVPIEGDVWKIPTPTRRFTIDLTKLAVSQGPLRNAVMRWIAFRLRTKSVANAVSAFDSALPLLNSPSFLRAAETRTGVPYAAFSEAQSTLSAEQLWRLHHARDFYRWCVDQRFPFFDTDVALRLENIVIGGNAKGEAVRSADPDKGPLTADEVAALALALRAARIEGTMPLAEQAALWLCMAFGANAGQYAMMREDDVEPQFVEGQLATTLVSVPRHKKMHAKARTEFQTRKVNRFVGRILQDLKEENERLYRPNDPAAARPLFWRDEPLDRGPGLEEWAWHLEGKEFSDLVQRAVKRLRVLSRAGGPLKINPRRLRYTIATRMVEEGASPWAVAVALDHTDLQNVMVYFDVHSGIVKHIDRAMAEEMGRRAQAFIKIVENEDEAINGDRKTSRRYFGDRKRDVFEPIGTCGSKSICNVLAPLGCYVCPKFQAWMNAPHDLVLDFLIDRRAKREDLGQSSRMVGLEDELIAAVAGVMARIAIMRSEGAGAA